LVWRPAEGRASSASPGWTFFSGEKFLAFDGADDESGEIVFAREIKTGHFRSLAADEGAPGFAARTAHAFDKLLDDLRIKLSHRQVIEKKKRLGALHKNVIDAVIDEVAADGGVDAHGHGDFQFCADAIGAGDQHGLFPFFAVERKESAEAADAAEHAGSEGAAGVMPDALLGVVRDGNIHPSIGIFHERPDRFRFRFGQSSRP